MEIWRKTILISENEINVTALKEGLKNLKYTSSITSKDIKKLRKSSRTNQDLVM